MLGDFGRDKALLGHVLRPWTVSRPSVVKAKRPCVTTQQVCYDRVAQWARGSVLNRSSVRSAMCTTGARAHAIRICARPSTQEWARSSMRGQV